MVKKSVISIVLIGLFLFIFSMNVMAVSPSTPSEKDKCPVCGMQVKPYPNWVAEIVMKDGTRFFFDGPKDMFKFYFNVKKYAPGRSQSEIEAVYVTDYYSTKMVDAKGQDVYFIPGSDVKGPMGMEIVPVKGKEQAETFMKDHNGKKMLRFDEVTMKDVPMGMKGMKGMKMKGM